MGISLLNLMVTGRGTGVCQFFSPCNVGEICARSRWLVASVYMLENVVELYFQNVYFYCINIGYNHTSMKSYLRVFSEVFANVLWAWVNCLLKVFLTRLKSLWFCSKRLLGWSTIIIWLRRSPKTSEPESKILTQDSFSFFLEISTDSQFHMEDCRYLLYWRKRCITLVDFLNWMSIPSLEFIHQRTGHVWKMELLLFFMMLSLTLDIFWKPC